MGFWTYSSLVYPGRRFSGCTSPRNEAAGQAAYQDAKVQPRPVACPVQMAYVSFTYRAALPPIDESKRKRRGSGALPGRKRPRAGHSAPDDSHKEHPAAHMSRASPDISAATNPRSPGEGPVEAPEIGKLYLTSWGKSNAWSVVLLLPLENLRSVGVPYSLADLGLADPVPECYEYSSHNEPPRLRQGYEIGGPMARERQYPVIYFDGREFPSKNAVGWVTASDLQIFDPNNASIFKLIEHRSQVRQYLEDQKTNLATPKTSSGPSQRTAATTGKLRPLAPRS